MPTNQELLTEAKDAYRRLMTGGLPVEVRDSNGESVRYSAANASRLWQWIKYLEGEVAGTTQKSRRPLRPVWG